MAEFLRIHEVGPRDGLQNEAGVIGVARKVALIDLLSTSGLHDIEVGSFVSPKRVPQMADTDQVFAAVSDLRDRAPRRGDPAAPCRRRRRPGRECRSSCPSPCTDRR